ncbi:ATP-binding protein [Leptolyngbya sp. CCNP1308]|uniref:ATP-binding protein n=1 Tax=Leptolyngbya sp. CCNP1308 TaxID=3110255 RepID=UPI002B2140D0|nr:ATP-binding protein [Leptolyngbya sp. CCNP1308]MEA5448742.1 ATP-binding protein [Leptolyngbya sp. CCNP1308]
MTDILTGIYNAVDPFRPLEPGDPAYVDCEAERGDANVLLDLGPEIIRSERYTCQLYAGHRGAGKSTELLRLKADLGSKGCFVVYFAAVGEDGDIDPQDVQYTDILLACTRHLLETLTTADPAPLVSWFKDRGKALYDLGQTQVQMDSVNVNVLASQFASMTANIRAVPSERKKIRDLVNPHTVTLVKALNEFIADGNRKLPEGKTQLVVIADNLDRIVPVYEDNGRSNHDEIFLDRSDQLKGLDCHLIYTVPIAMVYSNRANDLKEIYGNPDLLPMIMVQTPDGDLHEPGFEKLKEILRRRIIPFLPEVSLGEDVFEEAKVVEQLCLASGGHVRELLLLMKEALNRADSLPIPTRAVRRAISETRDTYRRTVEEHQWAILAKVAQKRAIENDEDHRDLLFRRCVMEYRFFDDDGAMQCWYDVHPLIKAIPEFRAAQEELKT